MIIFVIDMIFMNMKFKVTEKQIKLINEVNKVGSFDKGSPEYNYTTIGVLPKEGDLNKIDKVFFNGSDFGRSDYQKPESNTSVRFVGPEGEFKFKSDDIIRKNSSPYISGDKLDVDGEYHKKLLPLMKKNVINKPLKTVSIGTPLPNKGQVFNKLNSLSFWLSDSYGLGLKSIINTILEPLKTGISDSEIIKHKEGASILLKHNKISKKTHDDFLESLPHKKLVHDDDGKWVQVNKLNTNYSDLSELLRDLLFDSYEEGLPFAKKILEVIGKGDSDKIKSALKFYKTTISEKMMKKYSKSPEVLHKYVENSTRNSRWGEKVENDAKEWLLSRPKVSKIIYQGGDGDFIDMVFSIDLIAEMVNGEVFTFQVKSNEGQVNTFASKTNKNQSVDYAVWPGTNGKFNVRKIEKIKR
jgi:hypothetical protein